MLAITPAMLATVTACGNCRTGGCTQCTSDDRALTATNFITDRSAGGATQAATDSGVQCVASICWGCQDRDQRDDEAKISRCHGDVLRMFVKIGQERLPLSNFLDALQL